MSRPNKNKIQTHAQPGGGHFAAFAGLEISGLPDGPQPQETSPSESKSAISHNAPPKRGRVVLRRETAHRGGKCVIVVGDFDGALDETFIEALATRLRAACGCGGAVKNRTIEMQGDQPARIRKLLVAEGFRVAGIS